MPLFPPINGRSSQKPGAFSNVLLQDLYPGHEAGAAVILFDQQIQRTGNFVERDVLVSGPSGGTAVDGLHDSLLPNA